MEFDHINSLIVILIFGSLILLAFIKFTNPLNINKKGNAWFGVFLLLFASFWLEEIAEFSGFGMVNSLALEGVHNLQIFTPLALYFSILSYTIPAFKIGYRHLPHLILPFVYIIVHIYRFVYSPDSYVINVLIITLILSQSLFYALFSYLKLRRHQKSILLYSSNTLGVNLNWLEYILIQVIVICIIVVLQNIFVRTTHPILLVNSINLITVFIIAFFSLKQKEIFPLNEKQENELYFITEREDTKEKRKMMPDEDLTKIKKQLLELMVKTQPYLDSELNLVKLAEVMTVTPHQLSYIINSGFKENFFQFVNRHRVEKAKDLLSNSINITMIAIAFDSGFNSKTSFNTTFKKMTQQTPSEYRKASANL
jgi:AraC-like DNA-binding protein